MPIIVYEADFHLGQRNTNATANQQINTKKKTREREREERGAKVGVKRSAGRWGKISQSGTHSNNTMRPSAAEWPLFVTAAFFTQSAPRLSPPLHFSNESQPFGFRCRPEFCMQTVSYRRRRNQDGCYTTIRMSMTRKAILDDVTVDLNRIVCFIRSQIKNNKNWGKKKERSASPGLP